MSSVFIYNGQPYLSKKQALWAALFQILEIPFEVDQNFLFLPKWGIYFLPSDSYQSIPAVLNLVTLTGHAVAYTVDYPQIMPIILLYRLNMETIIAEILYAGFQSRNDEIVFITSSSLDLLKAPQTEIIGDVFDDKWRRALELLNEIKITEV